LGVVPAVTKGPINITAVVRNFENWADYRSEADRWEDATVKQFLSASTSSKRSKQSVLKRLSFFVHLM
jgi:hypothetical protein